MPEGPQADIVTPFADQAMRLLREKWANPVMLSEELFAILQGGVPVARNGPININLLQGFDRAAITVRTTGNNNDFMHFKDQFGNLQWKISSNGFEPGSTDTPRILPTINWEDPDPIDSSTPLSGTQLNAVAVDPRSGYEIAGTYTYSPASGATLSAGDNQPLTVVFTPENDTTYKRARKTVYIDVTAAAGLTIVADFPIPVPTDGSPSDTISVPEDALLIVVVATSHSASGVTVTVSDSDANTYTQIGSYVSEDQNSGTEHLRISAWMAVAALANPTLTFSCTPSAGSGSCVALGYSGADVGGTPVVGVATDSHHEISPSLGDKISVSSVAGAADRCVIAACSGQDAGTMTAATGGGTLTTFTEGTMSIGYETSASNDITGVECEIFGSGVVDQSYVGIGFAVKSA